MRRLDTPPDSAGPVPGSAAGVEPCPYCGETSGVQPTGTSPRVQAWSCACGTSWATTTVNPQPYLDRLTAAVEQLAAPRSILRQIITLADDAPTLPDQELRERLLALAGVPHPGQSLHPDPRLAVGRARPPTPLPAVSRSHIPPTASMPMSQEQEVAGNE
ncbi:MAG: hypothetical protein ACRDSZ_02920 [Pseudonocardiaceae bacterium]